MLILTSPSGAGKSTLLNRLVGRQEAIVEERPGVTRDRLYIETMERVLTKTNKVIIDSKGASAPIVLSPDTFKAKAPAAAAAPRAPGAAQ